MSDIASLELCKELYALSHWTVTEKHWYKGKPTYHAPYGWACPAYDLSFLLEKLPQNSWVGYVDTSGQRGYALAKTYAWNEEGNDINKIAECRADTLEDAACKLAILLWKQGILKRHRLEEDGSEKKSYTWEDKIECLVQLAKAVGSYIEVSREEPGSDGYKEHRRELLVAYQAFCEWRHTPPYVVDEIWERITDNDATGW